MIEQIRTGRTSRLLRAGKLVFQMWTRSADHHTGLRPVKCRTIKALQKTALDHAPKGPETSCTTGGNHRSGLLATTIAAPLGSFLGQFIGWRGAFFSVEPLAAITLVWLLVTLPSMPSRTRANPLAAFQVLRRPGVPLGMAAAALFFMGQFALFTYLRPFLETVTLVDVSGLSLLLLVIGVAGFLGTFLIGSVLQTRLYEALIAMPLIMAALALGLVALGWSFGATAGLPGNECQTAL